ncbi:MAG: hypothetical protein ACK5KR_06745 [Breznakia sp.]
MKKRTFGLVLIVIALFSEHNIIRIDNLSRTVEYMDTDYHMNSLPFIHLLMISLQILLIITIVEIVCAIIKKKKQSGKETVSE